MSFLINKKSTLKSVDNHGAEGGGRTRTGVTPPDFESGASANSTTSA